METKRHRSNRMTRMVTYFVLVSYEASHLKFNQSFLSENNFLEPKI
jgi:hypothetical protein